MATVTETRNEFIYFEDDVGDDDCVCVCVCGDFQNCQWHWKATETESNGNVCNTTMIVRTNSL